MYFCIRTYYQQFSFLFTSSLDFAKKKKKKKKNKAPKTNPGVLDASLAKTYH